MDMSSSLLSSDACFVGEHNGTYPDGTLGNGTFAFGHYVPTMSERMACQKGKDPWMGSAKYALWTTYFFIALFGLAAVVNGLKRLEILCRNAAVPSPFAIPSRFKAMLRTLDQPRPSSFLPTLGIILVTVAFTIFSFAVCFGIRPFYRPPNFGSSPLGLRSEWIATALIVWIFATALKRNALSYLSGISFHRLMSLHKVLPWFALFFSAVHTGAMIVRANRQQPWAVTVATNSQYGWSAWAALASLTWLCVLSLAPVRRLSHEFFYPAHIIAALVFLATCYLHFEALLGSWAYLHASVVIVGVAFLYRIGAVGFFSRGFTRPDVATLEALGDGAVAVEIEVKSGMRWSAGQHVFVRFLKLHPWSTHPFTIASLDPASLLAVADTSRRTMRLVLRPHSGLTARLAALARTHPSRAHPVLLDGPYGPSSLAPIVHGADSVLLVAGGTGMSFVAPVLAALVGVGGSNELHVVQSVRVVWAVPSEECLGWFATELEGALKAFGRARSAEGEKDGEGESLDGVGRTKSASSSRVALVGPTLRTVRVELYVTRAELSSSASSGEAKGIAPSSALDKLEHVSVLRDSRPDVGRIVDEAIKDTSGRLAVVTCGPPSLLAAARQTVARAQLDIVMGKLGGKEGKGASEVSLWEESFEL
ncbi:hypothetical protein JCM8208_003830 [Rhodotorula glutinis]